MERFVWSVGEDVYDVTSEYFLSFLVLWFGADMGG